MASPVLMTHGPPRVTIQNKDTKGPLGVVWRPVPKPTCLQEGELFGYWKGTGQRAEEGQREVVRGVTAQESMVYL